MCIEIKEKVQNFILTNNLLQKHNHFLLAFSGGADSTALMYILKNLGFCFKAVHINHNLRGKQSINDQLFAVELCKNLNIELIIHSINVQQISNQRKISVETAGRHARLDAFVSDARANNTDTIATAHHLDDNTETIVHRIMRGTGYRGLVGIKTINQIENIRFVRPLLCLSKKEILNYLHTNKIDYCTDSTNFENHYTRNKIRNLILPSMGYKQSSQLNHLIFSLSQKSSLFVEKLQKTANQSLSKFHNHINFTVYDRNEFSKIQLPIKLELARLVLVSLGLGEKDLTSLHYQQIITAANKENAVVNLPDGFFVKTAKNTITFSRPPLNKEITIDINGVTICENFKIHSEISDFNQGEFNNYIKTKDNFTEWFDYDKIQGALTIRSIKNGDVFVPIGKKTAQKISNYCLSKSAVIICDEQRILWIASVRPSQDCTITAQTKKIYKLTIQSIK